MTVYKIQEFINNRKRAYTKYAKHKKGEPDNIGVAIFVGDLEIISSMLDELELTKEPNWKMKIDWKDSHYTEYMCPNCGHCKCVLDPCELPPYCESCGKRLLQPEEKEHDDSRN